MLNKCIICKGKKFYPLFESVILDGYTLNQCQCCNMVLAFPANKGHEYDNFSHYGNYLIVNKKEIPKRVKGVSKRMKRLFRGIKKDYRDAKILDFGCGAGYFCKAAQEAGIDTFGVEPSEKLRLFSKRNLGLRNIVDNIDKFDHKFDVVFMFDVIEHLNPSVSKDIMYQIVSHLKPNGLLIGQTPNFESANIRLCGIKDPVIWPPSHSCYFTLKTLDRYLCSFGLEKVRLYSRGLSTNSFFRKTKLEKSFLEKGIRNTKLFAIPLHVSIKLIFGSFHFVMQPFNLGYQIRFTYRCKQSMFSDEAEHAFPRRSNPFECESRPHFPT